MEKRVVKVQFDPNDPKSVSRTQQHFKDACDVNRIVAKYHKTGVLGNPLIQGRKPFYGDFSKIKDLQTCLATVDTAMAAFNRLPGETKKKFNQDPQQLLDFVNNPANLKESVDLGLLPKSMLPVEPEKAAPAAITP